MWYAGQFPQQTPTASWPVIIPKWPKLLTGLWTASRRVATRTDVEYDEIDGFIGRMGWHGIELILIIFYKV